MDQAVEGERKPNQEAGGEQQKRENFPRWSEKTTVTNLVSALAVVDHQESSCGEEYWWCHHWWRPSYDG